MPHPKLLTVFGRTQSMADWAREKNIPYRVLKDRLRSRSLGWTPEEALTRAVGDGVKKDRTTESVNSKGLRKFKTRVGEKIGRLTIVGYVPGKGRGYEKQHPTFVCDCECGTQGYRVSPYYLLYRAADDFGCGCIHSERMAAMNAANATHRMSGSPEYKIWVAMLDRCRNKNNRSYRYYGGRGITVCDSWAESFSAFYADMGSRPSDDLELERKENDRGYSPDNCEWATRTEQANNKRSNIRIPYNGRILTLAQWCRELGVSCGKVRYRLRRGMPFAQIVSELKPGEVDGGE